jgi:hypothetical protein
LIYYLALEPNESEVRFFVDAIMKDPFITNLPEDQLHPSFREVRDSPLYAPARNLIADLVQEFEDPDGNFVQQFQTHGFDQRIFELFLFALFREADLKIDRSKKRPDFGLKKGDQEVWIEATTANSPPSKKITPYRALKTSRTYEELVAYFQDSTPIRLGSPLFTKLKAEYWREPHVAGKPFVIAIEDFHEPGALMTSSMPLTEYLFGLRSCWYHDEGGKLIISQRPIDKHKLNAKEIPSGFFAQPNADNVSAVLFSNTGTISKFNRIAQETEYLSPAIRMIRWGTKYRHNPNATNPEGFVYEVGDGVMIEPWREGTVLIHNPNAKYPVTQRLLGAAVEERMEGGQVISSFRDDFAPYSSITEVYPGQVPTWRLQQRADEIAAKLVELFGQPEP